MNMININYNQVVGKIIFASIIAHKKKNLKQNKTKNKVLMFHEKINFHLF